MLFSSKERFIDTAKYFSSLGHDFFITPLISSISIRKWKNYITNEQTAQLKQYKKTSIFPIFLKAPDSRFRNLLNPIILLRDFVSIFSAINKIRPHVIICYYVLDAYPLIMLKILFNYSLYVVATGTDVNLKRGLIHRMVRKFIYLGCNLIFATSKTLKERIEREYQCNVTVIPTGADSSFFKPLNSRAALRRKWDIGKEEKVILTVCRLVKIKGVDVVIEAFSLLNHSLRRDAELLIVGDGPEKLWLQKLASKLQIQQKTIFLGPRSRSELLELYNITDVFVLASYSEGTPRALAEAMACGCICIAANVGDVPRMIIEGFNGFIVKTGDPAILAEKINEVVSLPKNEMSIIKSRARLAVMNNFDQRKSAQKMIDLIISDVAHRFRRAQT